ncbi:hypothetical protein [Geothrix fermentans]|uniref:hypothetical protein n=1 Tax=Geothrix fermentans TaxID=44676 RepID=UPI00041E9F5E|nr:hypothetical protein [Geothrix fermentans]
MFRPTTLFAMAALTASLAAEDFGPVVKAAGLIYPGRNHFGVVCDYGRSLAMVADLQRALPEGSVLTVVDAHHPSQVERAGNIILQRRVQMLALLPKDALVFDGSPFATNLVANLHRTIPAFGTTPAALKNGCVMAMGQATNWELLFNRKLIDLDLKKGVIEDITITPWTNGGKGGPAVLDLVFAY